MRKLILFLFIACCFISATAQDKITGRIVDSSSHAVGNVTITYGEKEKAGMLGYAISDGVGKYTITIKKSDADSIWIKANHISFHPSTIVLKNKAQQYDFHLVGKTQQLEDFVAKGYQGPIRKKGDTINYAVDSFLSKKDQSIGDVIKKLPGIEMNGDQILYQGKPLKQYTIEGLDLMSGRYGMINNNLPADVVQKVQIVENDQPIKVLDSIMPSDQATLNIKLKKFLTTGSGTVGIGGAPFLWDVNVTPMSFFKNFQMLHTFQANNTGNTVSNQLRTLTSQTDLSEKATTNFLSVQNAGIPPFDPSKWLQNNIKLFNSNILRKTKKEWEWRSNISYVNDIQKRESYSRSILYLPNSDTVNVTQDIHTRFVSDDAQINLSVKKNVKSFYLNNSLAAGKTWHNNYGENLRNDTSNILQREKYQSSFIANAFNITWKWGKQLVTIDSRITYGQSPQTLTVSPGQFINLVNGNQPYQEAMQFARHRNLNMTNSISFIIPNKIFTVNVQAGFNYQSQWLKSHLDIDGRRLDDNYSNDLQFTQPIVYFNPSLQYKTRKENWTFSLSPQMSYQSFIRKYNGNIYDSTKMSRWISNPSFGILWKINPMWEASANTRYSKNFGGIGDMYTSYMLRSATSINRSNTTQITEGYNWGQSFYLKYNNLLKGLFANLSANYSSGHNNFINNTMIDSLGASYSLLIPLGNNYASKSLNGTISKLIANWKTTVKLSGRYSYASSDQYINQSFTKFTSENYGSSLQISNFTWDFFTFEYNGNLSYSRSWYPDRKLNNIRLLTQQLESSIIPFKDNMLTFVANYYTSNIRERPNQFFLNMKYSYKIPNTKTELAVTFNNVFNTKRFITFYNSAYSQVYSDLYLRPRQVLASVRFSFK